MTKFGFLGATALRSAAFVGLIAAPFAPAMAQDTPETAPAETTETLPQDSPAAGNDGEVIVVTGSRIPTNEVSSASPLQIIDPVLSQRQGQFNVAEMIQSSPVASGSSQISATISSNAVTNGGQGAATISLRGLGAERTLVLLNGRRAGPAGTRGAVASFDLNVLPQSIVSRVEILKDGASSIYGSDAVAGVVNVITKTDTDGIEFNGFASVPFDGAGESYTASITWGKEFEGGHLLMSADYYKQKTLRRSDRDFLGCPEDYYFRNDGVTRADLVDPRTGEYFCDGTIWGHVWTYSADNVRGSPGLLQFDYPNDGRLGGLSRFLQRPVVNGPDDLLSPAGWYNVGELRNPTQYALTNSFHPFEEKDSVVPGTDRITAYVDAAYDITDGIEIYGEFIYNNRKTYTDAHRQIYNFSYVDIYNDPMRPQGDPFPGFTQPFGGSIVLSPTGIIDDYDQWQEVDYYRGVAGLRGEIGGSWRFDVYGQYSLSDGRYTIQQVLDDAINYIDDEVNGTGFQNYKVESCVGKTTPISRRPCIDINWVDPYFLAGQLTQAQKDYLLDTETGHTRYEQIYGEASVTGNLFSLPGGSVGLAAGVVYRRDEIDDTPGHITYALIPGGDPNNPDDHVDNAFQNDFASGHTFGFSETQEAFAEINLPLLADVPFFEALTLSAAGRVTNVRAVRGSDGFSDESNGNWTYKLMGNWQITDWVRLRATYGTSYRAPALFEQFLSDQVSAARQINVDPCVNWTNSLALGTISQRTATNCAADGIPGNHTGSGIQVEVFQQGGIGVLAPETSSAKTASIILTPRFDFLPGTNIALTVDYFDIEVIGEIAQLGEANIVAGCYDSDNFPNDPLCDLFVRGQDGNPNNIRSVFDKFINVNQQRNRGVDVTARINQNLGALGSLSFVGNMTWQIQDDISLFDGTIANLNGEVGDPRWTGDFNLVWEIGDTSLFYGLDVVGAASNEEDFIELNGTLCDITPNGVGTFGNYCYDPDVEATFYHSVSITQKVMDSFELTLGVSNLFDTRPPRISEGSNVLGQSPFVSQYDWFGRRGFVSAKARF